MGQCASADRLPRTQPAASGTHQRVLRHSVAANATYPSCGGKAQVDGLICLTLPGGQPATGPQVLARQLSYNMYGQVSQVVDKTDSTTMRTTACWELGVAEAGCAGRPTRGRTGRSTDANRVQPLAALDMEFPASIRRNATPRVLR